MTYKPKATVSSFAALLLGGVTAFPVLAITLSNACNPSGAPFTGFTAGNLVVSRSVYTGNASTPVLVPGVTHLPPDCPTTAGTQCNTSAHSGIPITAVDNGEFPNITDSHNVWNNDTVDGSFGVTSPICIDQMTTAGEPVNTLAIPTNQIVTSFSSKSELSLNLSTDGTVFTFMGYLATPNQLDVSNANTTGVYDPTNPVGISVDRAVAKVDANGNLTTTDTYAYSGNNGRAAILASNGYYYTAGNDNNGKQPTTTPYTTVFQELLNSTGVEIIDPNGAVGNYQLGGLFSITQYGYTADKPGKDTNFRSVAIYNNTLYTTKGSGGNGINTVYQVGTAGTLPTPASIASNGGVPPTMTILPGFPTALATNANVTFDFPFAIWFANANTLYVADEGDGVIADAGVSTHAGLQKWVLTNGTWNRVYVMQNGLNLGAQYGVPNYPASINPATDGLRNMTGRVNADGTVTIWAVTSTVSANGDQGADPNKLVTITDVLANQNPAVGAAEQFTTVKAAGYGEVLRGVSFTPGTTFAPPPASIVVTSSAFVLNRFTHAYNGTMTITNNGTTTLTAGTTVTVALTQLTPGVTLPGAPTDPSGDPEVVYTIPQAGLAPGASMSLPVSFSDPSNTRIQYVPAVTITPSAPPA